MPYTHLERNKDGRLTLRDIKPDCLTRELTPGAYEVRQDSYGLLHITPKYMVSDTIIVSENDPCNKIMDSINKFFSKEKRKLYAKHGLVYKRAVLMYGEPGTGKSVTVRRVTQAAIEQDMVVLVNPNPRILSKAIDGIRDIIGNKQFVVVWEEFDSVVDSNEITLMSLLDGESIIENIFYLGTTNYIDEIPERIINRPSRISELHKVEAPDENIRRFFFEQKLKTVEEDYDIDLWVKLTEGMVIDNLKDLFVSVCIMDVELLDAVNKLREMSGLDTWDDLEEAQAVLEAEHKERKLYKERTAVRENAQTMIEAAKKDIYKAVASVNEAHAMLD